MLLNINEYSDNLVDNPINYISVSDSDKGKISYLNLDRIKSVSKDGGDLWKDSRYHAKPGSFVNKLFKGISQREVEIFSSLFRSESNKPKFELKVLVGEEIRTAYNYKSHSSDYGTLGASCMKHDSCYDYLNIYAKNKDVISMLAMYDEHKRIMGRAILWQEGSNKIMDRIYSVNDEILHLPFKKWATENGFLYKQTNYFDTLNFENMKTDKKELKLSFNIDMLDDNSFPYMDTFKFADTKKELYIIINQMVPNLIYQQILKYFAQQMGPLMMVTSCHLMILIGFIEIQEIWYFWITVIKEQHIQTLLGRT